MPSPTTLRRYADELGALESALAPLLARQKELKDALKAEGDGTYKGRDYEVTVSTTETVSLDSKAVKALLTPAQITACSKSGARVNVKVKARERLAVAA